jgi:uncharacterized membrane protein
MEQSCQKCGAKVGSEQAFCPRCGAVLGMSDAGSSQGAEWDMASTMVGKKLPATPPPRPQAPQPQPQQQTRNASAPSSAGSYAATPAVAPAKATTRAISGPLIAIIGFAAVLIIGGLLIFLYYLNSQG